jgi:hypothetical protein
MTPKEKAEELVDNFRQETDGIAGYNYDNVNKQCALIAVYQILNSNYKNTLTDLCYKLTCNELDNYWEEVKQEIEKL